MRVTGKNMVAHLGITQGLDLPDLLDLALNELLAAKARVHGHDEDEVCHVHDVLDGAEGGGGVQHNASLAAQVLNLRENVGVCVSECM